MRNHPEKTAPKSEKQNQHFIPRWWLKAFSDTSGNIWALRGDVVKVAAAGDIMSEDWIYTLFDAWWRPSDSLEDGLSKIEGAASKLFRQIEANSPSEEDWSALLWFIALTACRHPTAMERGSELSKEVGVFLSELQNHNDAEKFASAFATRFGSEPPEDLYPYLSQIPKETVEGTILHLLDLQPYDPTLPRTDALLATDQVANAIGTMDCRLLRSPPALYFVLGDHPLPLKNLLQGFTVPLSKSLALEAKPSSGVTILRSSATATIQEVEACNEQQALMAHELVIGPDRTALNRLSPVPR